MFRVSMLAITTLVVIGCSESPDMNVRESTQQSISDRSSNQLVHVQGEFVSIQPTGKRHQSYIFTFHIQDELHGHGQAPTQMDELVRFELYSDFGGGDLVAELFGESPPGGITPADAATPVTNSQTYRIVVWRFPSKDVYAGGAHIDAQLVGSALPASE